jgi:paraquat-inducible protein B
VPLTAELRRTAEELALAAATLREAAAGDSSLRLGADRALQDVSRAALALRQLSETVEAHPELLLRGRATAPATP